MTQQSTKLPQAKWRVPEWFQDLSDQTHQLLKGFHAELLNFNQTLNLISKKTEETADEDHFNDCIQASRLILSHTQSSQIVDVGSGNGFPGLILSALAPDRSVLLIDQDMRKVEFLKTVISRVGFSNAKARHGTIEGVSGETFTCLVSRGFAPLGRALYLVDRVTSKGSEYFHLKGDEWSREVAQIPSALCTKWETKVAGQYATPLNKTELVLLKSLRRA